MRKQHRIIVRRIGPTWRVDCPRCGMTWTRRTFYDALAKVTTHLRHNHA